MELRDWWNEIVHWRFTRYKLVNGAIGLSALLVYEYIGRPLYRPYIYAHGIFDLHIADTLGNTLGTAAAVFILISLLTSEKVKGKALAVIVPFSVVLYETAHPLLGKPIDGWDIAATIVTGAVCGGIFHLLFGRR